MEEKKIILVLNAHHFNTIMQGLGELPHKLSVHVVNELVKQAQEQINPDGTPK